jgi:hypothetical protein
VIGFDFEFMPKGRTGQAVIMALGILGGLYFAGSAYLLYSYFRFRRESAEKPPAGG